MTHRINSPDTDADIEIRRAVEQSKSFVVLAGAGSGKTTSLVKALAHIVKTRGQVLRQRRQKIACITYTEIATGEILRDVGEESVLHVSTIHSFLWDLAKPFQNDIRTWVCRRVNERLAELGDENASFGPRVQQRTRDRNRLETELFQTIKDKIGSVPRFRYEKGSDYAKGILGHDDIVKMVPTLIQGSPLLQKLVALKYPYFFVDESQDTLPEVVNALVTVCKSAKSPFCLGFFGDPMQKIYLSGTGNIPIQNGWAEITKPENFRCSEKVLSVINKIRRDSDALQQILGSKITDGVIKSSPKGTARIFILPSDNLRDQNLRKVRQFMALENMDDLWVSDDVAADVKILVIVHRMAAKRLGFDQLYSAFNDRVPDAISSEFAQGTGWALRPFLDVLLPLVESYQNGKGFDVISLLRKNSPLFDRDNLKQCKDPRKILAASKENVSELALKLSPSGEITVRQVLEFAQERKILKLDERFEAYLGKKAEPVGSTDSNPTNGDSQPMDRAMYAYFQCPASQLWGYRTYIDDKSPFSTHQGIKGAEFERVLVVLDDEEGTHRQFSYEKLLGIRPPSDTDRKNLAEGRDSVLDRTRRLFYVCCSRAKKDLAVVIFTADVSVAKQAIEQSGLFELDSIKMLDDLK